MLIKHYNSLRSALRKHTFAAVFLLKNLVCFQMRVVWNVSKWRLSLLGSYILQLKPSSALRAFFFIYFYTNKSIISIHVVTSSILSVTFTLFSCFLRIIPSQYCVTDCTITQAVWRWIVVTNWQTVTRTSVSVDWFIRALVTGRCVACLVIRATSPKKKWCAPAYPLETFVQDILQSILFRYKNRNCVTTWESQD